jgi:hypothetical protein
MEKISDFINKNNYSITLILSLVVTIVSIKLLRDINPMLLTCVLLIILGYLMYQIKSENIQNILICSLIIILCDNVISNNYRDLYWKIPYWTIISFYILLLQIP